MLELIGPTVMYRSYTGFSKKGISAASIVIYETLILGNDIDIDDIVLETLEYLSIPGDRLVWCTKNAIDAIRYGTVFEYDIPVGSLIIGEDFEGGYLVLLQGFTPEMINRR